MRPARRDRRGARRGRSAVLWAVGAAFVLYCVFLARLHGWTQQVGGVVDGEGLDIAAPPSRRAEAPAETKAPGERARDETAARALERAARRQDAAGAGLKHLRPGAQEPQDVATIEPATTIPVEAAAPGEGGTAARSTPPVATAPTQTVARRSEAATQTEAATPPVVALVEREAPGHESAAEKGLVTEQTGALGATEPPRVGLQGVEERLDIAVVPPIPLTAAPRVTEAHVPFRERHEVVAGYEHLQVFLESYMAPPGSNEQLFLFFVCSDQHFRPDDWSPECVAAKQHVYSVFATSPARNRLVTVLAGSERYWKFQNDFYNDPDLRVKGVPCLMRWEGSSGRTSGMMVLETLQYDVFLRYLFGNEDQPDPLLAPAAIEDKQIVTVRGYDAYLETMASIKREPFPVTTFMIMVSGRFPANNRPWCPYCRYSELPVEYAFLAFAPRGARLVRVEVTNSYNEWKHPNRFNRDPELDMHVVPALYKLQISPPVDGAGVARASGDRSSAVGSIVYERHKVRLDLLESLRGVFAP